MKITYPALVPLLFTLLFSVAANAINIVNDDFVVDGTQTTDAMYFASSNSSAIEVNPNSIGLVTGSSSRQMHALFATETLGFVGDALKATIVFTTPATVATAGEDMRIGIFDHLERISATELGQNTSYSTGSPNPIFEDLPGYYVELDVEDLANTDLDMRKSSPSRTGRLIATNGEFTALGNTPDVGYVFAPNTQYTVTMTFTALTGSQLEIRTDFSGFGDDATNTVIDEQPFSYNFGMLAMGASSDAFGISDTNDGGANNGIEIDSFVVEVIESTDPNAEPVSATTPPAPPRPILPPVVVDNFAADGTAETDASYFGSNNANAIEIAPNSIGLVTGTSGRQIHALFQTQTLEEVDERLEGVITFTTPETIGSGDLRVGIFDSLERPGLVQNTNYNSGSPNDDYRDLPGYFFQLDVEAEDPANPGIGLDAASDLDIRRHNIGDNTTGTLLATTTGFTGLPGSSGPDIGYFFAPETEYTINFAVQRNATDELEITLEFDGNTLTVIDSTPGSFNFNMIGLGAGSNDFGSTTEAGNPDNGIEVTNVEIRASSPEQNLDIGSDSSIVVVDDNFAEDGSTDTDANYFSSNNSNAIEFNTDSLGLVSGTAGRHIHGLFDTQSLERVGDILRAKVAFTTPDSVALGGDDLRIGLFDPLGRTGSTELGQNTTFNSSAPNDLFRGLPGYRVEIDVEQFSRQSDLEIGISIPTNTGRLLNTNDGFSRSNGPDIGYTIVPNTDYEIYLTVERTEDGLDISSNFFGREYRISDIDPLSFNFGMIAINASSDAFGVSDVPGAPDNGIDITNINIEFIRSQVVDDDLAVDGTVETDADYFGSSGSNAIEFNDNSVGLVSGSSGRQIHTLFDTQTLAQAGDVLETSVTFTTPATVSPSSDDLRFGLFDHLGRTGNDVDGLQLAQNTSYSSNDPNDDYRELPGYFFEIDVESADDATDFDIRRHNIGLDPIATTGRLLATTSSLFADGPTPFVGLPGSSGPDIGYSIDPNSSYTAHMTLVRNALDGVDITIALRNNTTQEDFGELTLTDASPASFQFGMLAMGASTNAFGSTREPSDLTAVPPVDGSDNGIDITDVTINFTRPFNPPFVELPEVELPTGDHPEVEIIPELPGGGDDGDGGDDGSGGNDGSGGDDSNGGNDGNDSDDEVVFNVGALPGILNLLLDDSSNTTPPVDMTDAEEVAEFFGLDPNAQPWENFELSDWALDAPNADVGPLTDAAGNVFGNGDGFSARTQDFHFAAGVLFPESEPFFFTGSDGAMVFKSTIAGARTSENTSFVRSELREMLRNGDITVLPDPDDPDDTITTPSTRGVGANNWALDHQPFAPEIGARGGRLTATLSMDQVTTTGTASHVGRVIIGQIHAEDDEPLRLYYRKLPNNTKGGIYAVHEIRGADNSLPNAGIDLEFDIIGSLENDAPDPLENGIALGELFSYEVNQSGSELEIIIRRGDRDGPIIGELTIDMLTVNDGGSSGYDVAEEWMYFKAGAYSQNNTGWANDFDQARFYRLENSHSPNVDPAGGQ